MSGINPIISPWTADITQDPQKGHTSGAETIDIAGAVIEEGRAILIWSTAFARRPSDGAVKAVFVRSLLKRQGGVLTLCDQQQPAAIGTAADLVALSGAATSMVMVGDTAWMRCVGLAGMELDWGVDHRGWYVQIGVAP